MPDGTKDGADRHVVLAPAVGGGGAPTPAPLLDYAVVIGLDSYRSDRFPALHGAYADACAFERWLLDPSPGGGGLRPSEILKLPQGPTPASPVTKDMVEDGICRMLIEPFGQRFASVADLAQPRQPLGRRLYLFFAGHGISSGAVGHALETLAMMLDASPFRLGANVPGMLLEEGLRLTRMFDEVVLFMDCCRSAPDRPVVPHLSFEDVLQTLTTPQAAGVRWMRVFATSWPSVSREQELPALDGAGTRTHGLFTWLLVKGLRGEAGRLTGGRVTAASLKAYLEENVATLSGGAQSVDARFEGDLLFSETVVAAAPTRVVVRLSEPARGLEVLDGERHPILTAARQVEPGVLELDLPNEGLYAFVVPAAGGAPERSRIVPISGEHIRVEL